MESVVPILPRTGDSEDRDRSALYTTSLTVLAALISVIVFYLMRDVVGLLELKTDYILPASILALIGAALFARIGYENSPGVFTTLARTTAAGIVAELIFNPPDFTLANEAYSPLAAYVNWGYWVAVPVAALSIWRPSFLYPAAFYVMSTRYAVNEISGFPLSKLDIRYMVEIASTKTFRSARAFLPRTTSQRQPFRGEDHHR